MFTLDFDSFRQRQRIFHINAEVSNSVLDFGVAKPNLHRPQIARRLAND